MCNQDNGIGRLTRAANGKDPSIFFAPPDFRWPQGLDKNMRSELIRFVGKGRRSQSPQKRVQSYEELSNGHRHQQGKVEHLPQKRH